MGTNFTNFPKIIAFDYTKQLYRLYFAFVVVIITFFGGRSCSLRYTWTRQNNKPMETAFRWAFWFDRKSSRPFSAWNQYLHSWKSEFECYWFNFVPNQITQISFESCSWPASHWMPIHSGTFCWGRRFVMRNPMNNNGMNSPLTINFVKKYKRKREEWTDFRNTYSCADTSTYLLCLWCNAAQCSWGSSPVSQCLLTFIEM